MWVRPDQEAHEAGRLLEQVAQPVAFRRPLLHLGGQPLVGEPQRLGGLLPQARRLGEVGGAAALRRVGLGIRQARRDLPRHESDETLIVGIEATIGIEPHHQEAGGLLGSRPADRHRKRGAWRPVPGAAGQTRQIAVELGAHARLARQDT